MRIRNRITLLFVFAPAVLLAQSFTASIRGVVTDSTKSAVPNAKITVTDVDRNVQETSLTDVAGRYVLAALPPGRYTLTVEAPGFARYSRSVFTLQVQQQATIDIELTVGAVSTAVEVEASAPLLNTTIATLGQVVENRFILSLPLAGRAPLALVALAPGVTPSNLNPGGQANTNFIANGTRNSSADVLLDGRSTMAVFKNVSFTERQYLQLRLEAFNVTNTPTFATPHMTFGASDFGVIDNYAGGRGPRELQVAIKYYF